MSEPANETVRRPMKQFEVVIAYGPYRVGDVIQPTGIYRDQLKARGVIRERVIDERSEQRMASAKTNRMVNGQGGGGTLTNRGKGR